MEKRHSSRENRIPDHRLRKERERRGLAHKDVAEFIGLPDPHTVGRWERAAQLFGCAESWLTPRTDMHPAQPLDYERAIERVRAQLGAQIFREAWSRGHEMTFEEALALSAVTN